jgi:hypothetical protein
MSQLKRIHQSTSLTQQIVNIRTVEQFKAIVLKFKNSASDAADTATTGDFGRLTYTKRGVTIIDANINMLLEASRLLYGTNHFTAGEAAATELFLYIPRRFGDNNVETVSPADNATITFTPASTFAARFDTNGGTTEIYLDCEQGVQKYDLAMRQYTNDYAAAGTYNIAIELDNLMAIFQGSTASSELEVLSSSVVTRLTTEVADQFRGESDLDASIWNTMVQFRHESTTEPLVHVPFYAAGDISSRLADSAQLVVALSGAEQIELLALGAFFDPERMSKTNDVQAQRLSNTLQRKVATGKTNTATAVKRLA